MSRAVMIPGPAGRPIFDEERSFWGAIGDTPVEDGAPRLIYADWLEEKGFLDQASFVRSHSEQIKASYDLLRDVRSGHDRLNEETILHGRRLCEIVRKINPYAKCDLVMRLQDCIGEFLPGSKPADDFDGYDYHNPREPLIAHHTESWTTLPDTDNADGGICYAPQEIDLGLFRGDVMDEEFFRASFDPNINWVEAAIRDPVPWRLSYIPAGTGVVAFADGWLVIDSRRRIWSIPPTYPFLGRGRDMVQYSNGWLCGYMACFGRTDYIPRDSDWITR